MLSVRDDGVGFDAAARSSGRGLGNLQLRTRQVGGRLEIESAANGGALVKFVVRIDQRTRQQMV